MVRAIISIQALKNNICVIKRKAKQGSRIIWVLKSNAYGHGSVAVAKLIPYEDLLAVARLDEAIELRKKGINNQILLLQGVFSAEELLIASEMKFDCILHNSFQLDLYCSTALPTPISVWLKVDTGMHRLGIDIEQAKDFLQILSNSNNICREIGFVSHLSTADDNHSYLMQKQIQRFESTYNSLKDYFPLMPSLSNSAAFFNNEDLHFHFSRIGIALYGISPFKNISAKELGLKPVMCLEAKLITKLSVLQGEFVGYGLHWIAPSDTDIGVVSIGYGDGYPRKISPGAKVKVNNRLVDVIGVACMDMLLIDLGQALDDKIGDRVVIWGEELSIESFAQLQSTIPYELVCNLTRRIKYIYI